MDIIFSNGSIEAGKQADFSVIAADSRQVRPEEVPQIPISMPDFDDGGRGQHPIL